MRLGFAVKVLGKPDLPSHDTRRHAADPHLSVSIGYLHAIFEYLDEVDVRMYRMSSNLAPYETHPDMPRFRGQVEACAEELAGLGDHAREIDLRLSTHPGQYTVLNSENPAVVEQAIQELAWHAALMDAMGLGREAVVVLHVGGAQPDKATAMDRFERGFARLTEPARRRLVIENDDRSFGVAAVCGLARRVGCPVVFDILHHHCHDPDRIPADEALGMALATWPAGVTPKVHVSSPRTVVEERKRKVGRRVERSLVLPQVREHADMIDPIAFEHFLRDVVRGRDLDVMLEAKAKDLALLRLRDQMRARGVLPIPTRTSENRRRRGSPADAPGTLGHRRATGPGVDQETPCTSASGPSSSSSSSC